MYSVANVKVHLRTHRGNVNIVKKIVQSSYETDKGIKG